MPHEAQAIKDSSQDHSDSEALKQASKPSTKTKLLDTLKGWALNHTDFIFGVLRWVKPILSVKAFTLVTRYQDVQEVLSRDDAFNVTYAEKMHAITNGSNFFLGMPPSPRYQQDVSNSRIALRRTDIETIVSPLVDKISQEIVSKHSGNIDFVKDLSSVVPARLVAEYIGIPGPSQIELVEWTSHMFHYLFFPNTTPDEDKKALEDAAKARNYIDQLILKRKNTSERKDDVLGRFLDLQSASLPGTSDTDIRNNLIGIIIGAIPTTSKAATLVLQYLLENPKALSSAQSAARDNDIEKLNQHVLESLRFKAFNPGVFRQCTQDYTIARGTFRSKTIKKGSTVLASTQSGMMDGRKIKKPKKFDIGRPPSAYMPYGYGLHTCFGQYINNVQIALILKSVLVKENLQADIANPTLDGPFPTSFPISYS